MPLTAQVAVSDATVYYDKRYSYRVPPHMEGHLFVGGLVLVPFGAGRAKPRLGVVLALEEAAQPPPRLKEILEAAPDEAALSDELLAIVTHLKESTFCTWFEAVRAVVPAGAQYRVVQQNGRYTLRRRLAKTDEAVFAPGREAAEGERLTTKQQAVLAAVAAAPCSQRQLATACNVGPSVAKGLLKRGLLRTEQRALHSAAENEGAPWAFAGAGAQEGGAGIPPLSAGQRQVSDALTARMAEAAPRPALLYGVTGSGKTLVFLELVRAALRGGKTALILVPEIGLTPQMIGRLQAAFGGAVAVQHSGLAHGARMLQWRQIKQGEAKVVVGTRSAVFAPLENIGLIVVDEEQERSYQSEQAPRYDAVDIARRRAARHGALLVLASATPAVKDFYFAKEGRYELLRLNERYGNVPLPAVQMVDMNAEAAAGNAGALSGALLYEMQQNLEKGEQTILLLNRRGFHRVGVCRACNESVKCGECSVPMVYHRGGRPGSDTRIGDAGKLVLGSGDKLLCHYCGKELRPPPSHCPKCGGEVRYAGFGTQRLEEELARRLPGARLVRMDTDSTSRRGAHAALLRRFAAGEYDVLLGTQMVAKGLDFEKVSLVGVIGIDSLLFGQGYRSYEQVFALLTQVVGRSGRAGRPGRALVQTADVRSTVLTLAASQDYDAFYAQEIEFRRLGLYPPFCALCTVGFAAKEEADAVAAAARFAALLAKRAAALPALPLRILGPAAMPVVQLAGSYRYRLTLKCRNDRAFRQLMRAVLADYSEEKWPRRAGVWLDFYAADMG